MLTPLDESTSTKHLSRSAQSSQLIVSSIFTLLVGGLQIFSLHTKMSTLVDFPTSLPTAPIPQDTQAVDVATSFELDFSQLGPESFKNDAVWRDVFALTGTLRTFYGPSSISAAWNETSKRAQTSGFRLDSTSARISRLPTGNAWVEVLFYFETGAAPAASCAGLLSLVPGEDGKWQIWVMRSFLEQLKSQPSVDILEAVGPNATNGTTNGSTNGTNGHSKIHFDCVVIGGGQAGLSAGGRLKALGISYVILEKFENVGDNWMTRYSSARCMFPCSFDFKANWSSTHDAGIRYVKCQTYGAIIDFCQLIFHLGGLSTQVTKNFLPEKTWRRVINIGWPSLIL